VLARQPGLNFGNLMSAKLGAVHSGEQVAVEAQLQTTSSSRLFLCCDMSKTSHDDDMRFVLYIKHELRYRSSR
jgi:hypothetical protein